MTTPELLAAVPDPDAIRRVFAAAADLLLANRRVEVDGFGVFELVVRKARAARNPRTGARVDVPARAGVRFRPAAALKARAAAVPPTRAGG
jgi:nucleoid DNA-binding protein